MQKFLISKPSLALKQVEEYLHHCEFVQRTTYQTLRTKRIIIARFVREMRITDFQKLTNRQISEWHAKLAKEGKAGKTINNYQEQVVCCVRYLGKHGYRIKIDFDMVHRAIEEERDQPWFTREEIELIKQSCQGLRELLMTSILFDSAVRISELKNLRVEDIKGNTIKVVQGKGRKDGTTFMTDEVRDLLDRWLVITGVTEGYIFPSPDKFGAPLSVSQIRNSITPPIRRAGIEAGSAHAFRRSKATDIYNNGGDIVDAQGVLRHKDISTTRKYIYITDEQKYQRYQRFASPQPS